MSFIIGLAQNLVELIYFFIPTKNPSLEQIENCKIVAHRGWHNNINILENTLKSFEYAEINKLAGIEFDIRWTKDLVPIVHHDKDLGRIFGAHEMICRMNFKDLRIRFPEVPTLAEVVDQFGGKLHLFIEIKEEHFPEASKQNEILKQVLSQLKEREHYHFLVLSEKPTQILKTFDKKTTLMVANTNVSEMSDMAMHGNWGGITAHYLLFNDRLLRHHKNLAHTVGTGFPKSLNPLKKELNRNIDWIFTNHPWKLLKGLHHLKNKA